MAVGVDAHGAGWWRCGGRNAAATRTHCSYRFSAKADCLAWCAATDCSGCAGRPTARARYRSHRVHFVEPFPPFIPPKVRDQRRSDRSGRATHAQRGARFDGVADRRPRTTFGWDGGCVRFRTRKSSRFEGSALTSRRWRRRPQRTCDRCDAPGSFALCGSLWWFARRRTAVAHIEGCTSTRVGRLPPTTPAAAVTAGKTKAGANVDSPWPQPPPTPLSPHFVLPPNSCQPSHHPFPLHRCSLDRCPAQRASRGAPTGAGHGVAGVAAGLRRSPRHQRLRQLQLWGAKTTKKARGGARVPGGRPSVLGGSELCISKI